MERMQFEDTFYESKIRNLKFRYARKRRRMALVCLITAVIVFTTVAFLMNWPSEADTFSRGTVPVFPGFGDGNELRYFRNHIDGNVSAQPKYLLNSKNCRVQDFPPFHSEAVPYFAEEPLESCSKLPLLSSVSANPNGSHTLHYHKDLIPIYSHGTEMSCCYSIMSLDFESADLNADVMQTSDCKKMAGDVLLNETVEFVEVTCHIIETTAFFDNESIQLYKNVHAFVGMKPQVKAKIDMLRKRSHGKKTNRDYSVMIFGIDSMSRLNFLRTMPKTADYLEKKGWLPLKVYNKAGENTIPNLGAAVLAGIQVETLNATCWSNASTTVDECPWIFKKFSEKGYITAYAEDTPQHDTFSTRKFSKPPTDYFLRPFMRAAERLSSSNWYEKFLKFFDCLGPVHGVEHVLNYSLDFTKTFKNHPTFSLFWLNTFTHSCLNCAWGWDGKIAEFFQNLEPIRENTIVIFMSDHGPGFGTFRQTNMGFFESNLPFVYFSLPESFVRSRPTEVKNLVANEFKLSSPFDVHVTLLDVLGADKLAPGCPKCRSLFEELPHDRSCADAGIPERYCACTEYDIVTNTTPYKIIGDFLVKELNAFRRSYNRYTEIGQRCASFSLKGMKPIKIAVPPGMNYRNIVRSIKSAFSSGTEHDLFVVTVETMPRAVFEATVSINKNRTLKIEDTINRLDEYEKTSTCMDYPDGKKYCFCEANRVEF